MGVQSVSGLLRFRLRSLDVCISICVHAVVLARV